MRKRMEKLAAKLNNQMVLTETPVNLDEYDGTSYKYIVGKTLELLTYADVAFFSTGWEMDTGCRIEHICAVEYGVQIIGKLDTEVRSNALTKSELDDIETHLIWVQGYYKKRLHFLKQMERRKDSEGRLEYPAVTGIIENLRELDENVEQLLTKIKGLE